MIYRAIPLEEVMATLSPERQAGIRARAAVLIAEEMALRDLEARELSQEQHRSRSRNPSSGRPAQSPAQRVDIGL